MRSRVAGLSRFVAHFREGAISDDRKEAATLPLPVTNLLHIALHLALWLTTAFLGKAVAQAQWRRLQTLPIGAEVVWPVSWGGWLARDRAGVLRLYDTQGQPTAYWWTDQRLGVPDLVDVSQPLLIILFFRDWQQVVWLDRTLSVVASLSFAEVGVTEVAAVGAAPDGKVWTYLPWSRQLVLFDREGKVVREGPQLDLILSSTPGDVRWLRRHEGRVYLAATHTVWAFDDFGQYAGKYDLPEGAEDVQIAWPWLVCRKRGQLWLQHLVDPFQEKRLTLPELSEVEQVWWRPESLWVLSSDGVLEGWSH